MDDDDLKEMLDYQKEIKQLMIEKNYDKSYLLANEPCFYLLFRTTVSSSLKT